MPSLLLVVLLLQFTIYLINSVGVTTINELASLILLRPPPQNLRADPHPQAWLCYNNLPTPTSAAYARARLQRADLLKMKAELSSISAQDDFARWARLRRQHDKAATDYDTAANSLKASKARFEKIINTTRWLATNGLRFFLQYWYVRKPIFWLPKGAMPSYAEWLLSFPRAPMGSVSIQVWGIACASVMSMIGEVVVAAVTLARGTSAQSRKGEPIALGADLGRNKGQKVS